MTKKIFVIVFLLGGYLFCCPQFAQAEDEVKLEVKVLPRKMTDTINDFIWDGQAPPVSSTPLKAVLGASTEANTERSLLNNSNQFEWRNLLFLLTVYDIYYLSSR